MEEMIVPSQQRNEEHKTEATRFLNMRGVLMMKESRDVDSVKDKYGVKINIGTLIISSKVSNKSAISYSITFEMADQQGHTSANAHLDYNETEEFINAFSFIFDTAKQMQSIEKDYTEVLYVSKDGITFGFYQMTGQPQQPFFKFGHKSAFLSFEKLDAVRQAVETAKAHLVNHGADV
jgi:hypothetical protein